MIADPHMSEAAMLALGWTREELAERARRRIMMKHAALLTLVKYDDAWAPLRGERPPTETVEVAPPEIEDDDLSDQPDIEAPDVQAAEAAEVTVFIDEATEDEVSAPDPAPGPAPDPAPAEELPARVSRAARTAAAAEAQREARLRRRVARMQAKEEGF